MRKQTHRNNRRRSVSAALSGVALLFLLLCPAPPATAQEMGQYVVPVRTKRYARLPTSLIRNTEPAEVTVVNGEVYFQGDVSLGKEAFLDSLQQQGQSPQFAVVGNWWATGRWDGGIVPFVILPGFTEAQKQNIIDAMNHIAQRTNVCFRPRSNQRDYIKFKKVTVAQLGFSGGQSKLGRCGPPHPDCLDGQEIKLTATGDGLVRHEILHALGVLHEHTREDRNRFVEILWDNIESHATGNFIQAQLVSTDIGSYDFDSIMHYHATAFGKKIGGVRQQTIRRVSNHSDTSFGRASSLSAGDVTAVNTMYPTAQGCAPLTLNSLAPGELAVGQSRTMNIAAKTVHNLTGIFMRENQRFEFSVASPEWNNGSRETTAAGYNGSAFDLCRRHPDLKMMALVGEIFGQHNNSSYTGTYFRIGMSRTWRATRDGFLVAFANDCLPFYADNSRVVTLTVKRLE